MKRLLFVISISLPFPAAGEAGDEKLVMAHYMTDMVPRTRGKLIRWIDPELADPRGSTAALGGIHQARSGEHRSELQSRAYLVCRPQPDKK